MKLIRSLMIFLLVTNVNTHAFASNDIQYKWLTASFEALPHIMSCIKVPRFVDTNTKTINVPKTVNSHNAKEWVKTGIYVEKGKLLQINLLDKVLKPSTKKYRVLYRIDPRFKKPQVFIQKYDFAEDKYISDFPKDLDQYNPKLKQVEMLAKYTEYFNFETRPRITVREGDVISITLGNENDYFSGISEMGSNYNPFSVYTDSSMKDNTIIYTNSKQWCDAIIETDEDKEKYCKNGFYQDLASNWKTLEGRIDNSLFQKKKSSIKSCPHDEQNPPTKDESTKDESTKYRSNKPLCFYDKGMGMKISVGDNVIKHVSEKFVHSPFYSKKDFFYHQSEYGGDLDFTTDWKIDGMYPKASNASQIFNASDKSDNAVIEYLQDLKDNPEMEYLHFGRYFMYVEVGGADLSSSDVSLDNIKIEYKINDGDSVSVGQDFRGNASESGYLSLIVTDDSTGANYDLAGTVKVNVTNYVGSNWFSATLYESFIKPFRENINEASRLIYNNLIQNQSLRNISHTALVLYIIIYALTFLAGAVKITMMDLVVRIIKISVVVAVFSEKGWSFLNQDLFNFFVDGTDYLLTSVVGVTSHVGDSNAGNVFGFIDPVFNKFVTPEIWGLLLIQALQIHTGLTFMAIMTMYSLIIYFSAILGVVIRYCLSFLGIAIMMSILPFFIILMLFERTKSIFDNWISIMFSYMMQPTLLLIFFLLIDQIINEQIAQALLEACWNSLVKISITLDPKELGIPISFPPFPITFDLPFFPGIHFFVPKVNPIETINDFFEKSGTVNMVATSSFLLFALCLLARGLVDYVALVVQVVTNVLADRQDGKIQTGSNPVKDITSSFSGITKPIGNQYRSVKEFAKRKFVDGDIMYTEFPETQDIKYDRNKKKKDQS